MQYANITPAVFQARLNRFTARVLLHGAEEIVHVKNTGRLGELLVPGAEVYLTAPGSPGRKTAYDLVCVRAANGALFNIDSFAPNAVVGAWLQTQTFDRIVPEYAYGASRIDFYMERGGVKYLLEVKGCTLVRGGVGYFPDAPTERGVKHLAELSKAAGEGYRALLAFVIQTEGVSLVRPNTDTHPAFAEALAAAQAAGVRVLYLPCAVTPVSLSLLPDTPFPTK